MEEQKLNHKKYSPQCPVCLQNYNNDDHKPYYICENSHSMCITCLNTQKKYRSKNCPICKQPLTGSQRLNKDILLLLEIQQVFIEEIQQTKNLGTKFQQPEPQISIISKVLLFIFVCSWFIPFLMNLAFYIYSGEAIILSWIIRGTFSQKFIIFIGSVGNFLCALQFPTLVQYIMSCLNFTLLIIIFFLFIKDVMKRARNYIWDQHFSTNDVKTANVISYPQTVIQKQLFLIFLSIRKIIEQVQRRNIFSQELKSIINDYLCYQLI